MTDNLPTTVEELREQLDTRSYAKIFTDQRIEGAGLNYRRELEFLFEHMLENQTLREVALSKAGVRAFHNCLVTAASLGLTLQKGLGLCYPIPYIHRYEKDGRKVAVPVVKATASYRGLQQMAYRSGVIEPPLESDLFRENDSIKEIGRTMDGPYLRHVKALQERGDVIGAYCKVNFTSGKHDVEYMPIEELNAIEACANKQRVGGFSAWKGPFKSEMQRKCPIRRNAKHWPRDSSGYVDRMISHLDEQLVGDVIEGEAVEYISEEKQHQLADLCAGAELPLKDLEQAFGAALVEFTPDKFQEAKAYLLRREAS